MKIAVLHSGDLDKVSPGGVTQYIKNMIHYFENDEITLFGTVEYKRQDYKEKSIRYYDNKRYFFIPISTNRWYPLSIFYFFKIFTQFKNLKQYDIIYCQRMEYVLPFIFNKQLRKKTALIIHGSVKYAKIYYGKLIGYLCKILEKLSVRTAQKIFIIIKRESSGLPFYQKRYNKFRDKFIYSKIPVNTELFTPNRHENDINCKILYCGRVENEPKRVFLFPQIIKIISQELPNVKLIVLGDGADLEKLKRKAKEDEVEKYFEFLGYRQMNIDTIDIMKKCKVAINISKFEGTCTASLEAIACGVPVVSTDAGDIAVFVANGTNGIVISNGEDSIIEDASAAIINIIKNGCKMNTIYMEYDGKQVFKELRKNFSDILGE